MRAACLSVLLMALAVPAAAQPARGTVFATVSGVAAEESAPSAGHGALFTGDRFDGATHGGVLGVGVHLSPRWTIRAEWHLTGALFVKETLPPADAAEIALARQFAATAVQFGFPPGPAEDYLVRGGYEYERRDRVGLALGPALRRPTRRRRTAGRGRLRLETRDRRVVRGLRLGADRR